MTLFNLLGTTPKNIEGEDSFGISPSHLWAIGDQENQGLISNRPKQNRD